MNAARSSHLSAVACGALLISFTACAQGVNAPLPTAPTSSNALHGKKLHAKLIIKVPRHRRHGKKAPRYISPATASLAYSVDGKAQPVVNIATSNPNCQVVGPISYLQCTIPLVLSPGNHTFSFTTYDQTNGSGNVLSANTNVSYDVKVGQANEIPVILGGVATSLVVTPLSGSYTVYGSAPQKVSIVPLDADDNFIVGPGAPQPVVQATPANMTVSTPSPSSPNVWTLTSTYSATDPTIAASTTISVSASPVPNSGGSTVTASASLNLYEPWLYVWSGSTNSTFLAFDEQGNLKQPAGSFSGSSPNGLAYDSHNQLIYWSNEPACAFSGGAAPCVAAFNTQGVQQTLSGGSGEPFGANYASYGIAYDSHDNDLYVADFTHNTIKVFDEQGNPVTVSGTWSGVSAPREGVLYNPSNNFIYVINTGVSPPSVTAYDEQGNQQTLSGTFPGLQSLTWGDMTYDPDNGYIYIVNDGSANVTAYDGQGNQQTLSGTFPGLSSPRSVVYDPYTHWLYTDNSVFGGTIMSVFDAQGHAQTVTGSWSTLLSGPTYMVFVP